MKIVSTSDVHCPEYLQLFSEALKLVNCDPDLVLFAGDMVDKNNAPMYRIIIEMVTKKFPRAKIIAVFGNEEYRGYEKLYEFMYREVTWLNDNYIVIGDKELCIIGTRGALDKPTSWQAKNIPGIYRYYSELPAKIEQVAMQLRSSGCKKILLISHYGVTRRNLIGEREETYPYLASSRFEKIIRRDLFDLVIHGHVHQGVYELVYVGGVPVYNVALPARRKIIEIEI